MLKRILVFGGTTEGRKLSVYLAKKGFSVTVCVATDYGDALMPEHKNLTVMTGRLDGDAMEQLVKAFDLIVDTTHPYADIVTKNIRGACEKTKRRYIRLVRPVTVIKNAVPCKNSQEAVLYLKETQGNILLTTGSKTLPDFTGIPDFQNRLYVRVIPSLDSLRACLDLGILPSHILCMQGPFSKELNLAVIRHTGAKFLVTKDSGEAGGLYEKLSAADEAGVKVVLIKRPSAEQGMTLQELTNFFNHTASI